MLRYLRGIFLCFDGCDEDDGGAAIARAVDAEARGIDLGLRAEKGQRRLDVGDPAIWRQAALRPLAVAPALVVEAHYDVTGFGEHARVVRQVDAPDAGIAVAQHDAGPPVALFDISRQEQIARKLDALAVEAHGLRHASLCSCQILATVVHPCRAVPEGASAIVRASSTLAARRADLLPNYLSQRLIDPILPAQPGFLKL